MVTLPSFNSLALVSTYPSSETTVPRAASLPSTWTRTTLLAAASRVGLNRARKPELVWVGAGSPPRPPPRGGWANVGAARASTARAPNRYRLRMACLVRGVRWASPRRRSVRPPADRDLELLHLVAPLNLDGDLGVRLLLLQELDHLVVRADLVAGEPDDDVPGLQPGRGRRGARGHAAEPALGGVLGHPHPEVRGGADDGLPGQAVPGLLVA